MLRVLLSGFALGAAHTTLGRAQVERQPAQFSLVLESTPTGWAARCDSGCRWRQLAFDCERACRAVVDANGLVTVASPRPDSTAFLFLVERTPTGVSAESRLGTAWKMLSWECQSAPCRARVDAYGVSGERITR